MSQLETVSTGELGLSALQQAVLSKLLKREAPLSEELKGEKIPKREIQSPVALSFAQQRLWILDQMVPGNPFYNIPTAVEFNGKLDIDVFERSLNEVVRRHESLRTIFTTDPETEEPVQVILPELELKIETTDIRGYSHEEKESMVTRALREYAARPFNLEEGPLVRVSLLHVDQDKYLLQYIMHHIISDTWSMEIFTREFSEISACYSRGESSPLPELPLQYADFAVWQRRWLKEGILEKQLSYWRDVLSGELPILELPTDRQRPAVSTYRGNLKYVFIPEHITGPIMELNRKNRCSMFMTLLAAFNVLLYRYSGQEDILVGSPIANRNRAEVENMIGFFANTLVFRTELSGNPSFSQLLARVRKVTTGAYDNQDVPFEKLVEELQPHRYMSHTPFFQVMFVMQNVPTREADTSAVEDAEIKNLPVYSGSAKFDLWLSLTHYGRTLSGSIEYSTDIFEDSTINRFLEHLETLLTGIGSDPEQLIGDLPLLPGKEKKQILEEWNNTDTPYRLDCLHHSFAEQVKKTPGQIAVIYENSRLSYLELHHRSNRLAHYLLKRGVKVDMAVGVCLERSLDMVIALMGILKAGGAYLPLDPEYPRERLAFMTTDAAIPMMVTNRALHGEFPPFGGETIFMDGDGDSIFGTQKKVSRKEPGVEMTIENLAYIIYTSGSTGKPKGAMVPHKGISNRLLWMQEAYRLTSGDRILQKTPFSFDVSVWEFFWPLITGAGLVEARPGGHKDSEYLVKVINEKQVTTIHFVPTMLNVFLEDQGLHTIRSLKRVICSGEALPLEYQQRFFARFGARVELHNLYGPTEASVDVTSWACLENSSLHTVPIGKPIANTQIYMLNKNLDIVPIGIHGELHIGGIQLARGYLNRPELTEEKFVLFNYSSYRSNMSYTSYQSNKLYKTGDLARWLPDGNIEYIGRLDFQVKVRGFRIELGEIESALRSHEAVSDAVALAREDSLDSTGKKLVAYLVPDTGYWQARGEGAASNLFDEQVTDWQGVFDDTYTRDPGQADPTFNIIGWNSSYTGSPLPPEEMKLWVDRTVERILALNPRRVMEIGCGTGLYLFPIIPHCDRYLGTDIAGEGLEYIRRQLERLKTDVPESGNWAEVELMHRSAENFENIAANDLDLVILNSVVQYFPSADYLVQVLKEAADRIQPGGHIFIGDVRGLPLLKTFHASVEVARAEPGTPKESVLRNVLNKLSLEQELVIDPRFFSALKKQVPRIKHADVLIKYGRYSNELSKFRCDVILHVGEESRDMPCLSPDITLDWKQEKDGIRGMEDVRGILAGLAKEGKEPDCLVITSVPNARLLPDIRALKTLTGTEEPAITPGFHPDDFLDLAGEFPYHIAVLVSPIPGEEGIFDVVLTHRRVKEKEPYTLLPEIHPLPPVEETINWNDYTNNPLLVKISGRLVPELRTFLKDRLPEYMVPTHFVLLDRLPVTSSGKLDRKALPEPVQVTVDPGKEFVEPSTETEITLAQLWKEILNLEKVSVTHNFFELGGDSINAIQMVSRANKKGLEISVQLLFQNQTIAEMARATEKNRVKSIQIDENTYKEFVGLFDMETILKQLPDGLEIEDIYPATPLQRHQAHFFKTGTTEDPPLFLYQRWDHPFNMPLDVEALKRSLQIVSDRNTLLRTLILWEGLPEPIQVVCKQLTFDFVYHDLSAVHPDRKKQEFYEKLQWDWNNTYQRNNSSPMRVGIFKLEENLFQYYFMGDYMRMEGWSANNLMSEIFAVYRSIATGAPVPPKSSKNNCYKDYLHALRNQDKTAASQYWRSIFKGFTGGKSLAAIPGNQTGCGTGFGGSHLYLSPEMSARLEQFLLEHKLSLSVVMQGTWAALLGHYLQQDRVVYGLVTTGRSVPIAGIEEMSGHSINILPVAVPLSPAKSYLDYLKDIWSIQTEWTRYDYTTIDDIFQWCDLPENLPLFDHYIVIQNLGSVLGELRGGERDGAGWKRDRELMFAKMEYPLRFDVFSGYEYCFTCHYYLRYFTTPAIKGLLDNLKTLVESLIENSRQTVADIMKQVDTGKYKLYENESPDGFIQR